MYCEYRIAVKVGSQIRLTKPPKELVYHRSTELSFLYHHPHGSDSRRFEQSYLGELPDLTDQSQVARSSYGFMFHTPIQDGCLQFCLRLATIISGQSCKASPFTCDTSS